MPPCFHFLFSLLFFFVLGYFLMSPLFLLCWFASHNSVWLFQGLLFVVSICNTIIYIQVMLLFFFEYPPSGVISSDCTMRQHSASLSDFVCRTPIFHLYFCKIPACRFLDSQTLFFQDFRGAASPCSHSDSDGAWRHLSLCPSMCDGSLSLAVFNVLSFSLVPHNVL